MSRIIRNADYPVGDLRRYLRQEDFTEGDWDFLSPKRQEVDCHKRGNNRLFRRLTSEGGLVIDIFQQKGIVSHVTLGPLPSFVVKAAEETLDDENDGEQFINTEKTYLWGTVEEMLLDEFGDDKGHNFFEFLFADTFISKVDHQVGTITYEPICKRCCAIRTSSLS